MNCIAVNADGFLSVPEYYYVVVEVLWVEGIFVQKIT